MADKNFSTDYAERKNGVANQWIEDEKFQKAMKVTDVATRKGDNQSPEEAVRKTARDGRDYR